jgi:hypothetical protein
MCSLQAYQFDRESDIDTRSEHYGKPSSLLRKGVDGIPSYFSRRTEEDLHRVVSQAAASRTVTEIKRILNDNGLCYEAYTFDRHTCCILCLTPHSCHTTPPPPTPTQTAPPHHPARRGCYKDNYALSATLFKNLKKFNAGHA